MAFDAMVLPLSLQKACCLPRAVRLSGSSVISTVVVDVDVQQLRDLLFADLINLKHGLSLPNNKNTINYNVSIIFPT